MMGATVQKLMDHAMDTLEELYPNYVKKFPESAKRWATLLANTFEGYDKPRRSIDQKIRDIMQGGNGEIREREDFDEEEDEDF